MCGWIWSPLSGIHLSHLWYILFWFLLRNPLFYNFYQEANHIYWMDSGSTTVLGGKTMLPLYHWWPPAWSGYVWGKSVTTEWLCFHQWITHTFLQLVTEAGVGIAVMVRCFVHKKNMEAEIVDRLGNGFSLAPFATVVVTFTWDILALSSLFWLVNEKRMPVHNLWCILTFLCRLYVQQFHYLLVFL